MARALDDLVGKKFAVNGTDITALCGKVDFIPGDGAKITYAVATGAPGQPTTLELTIGVQPSLIVWDATATAEAETDGGFLLTVPAFSRSEERRGGKEGRYRSLREH